MFKYINVSVSYLPKQFILLPSVVLGACELGKVQFQRFKKRVLSCYLYQLCLRHDRALFSATSRRRAARCNFIASTSAFNSKRRSSTAACRYRTQFNQCWKIILASNADTNRHSISSKIRNWSMILNILANVSLKFIFRRGKEATERQCLAIWLYFHNLVTFKRARNTVFLAQKVNRKETSFIRVTFNIFPCDISYQLNFPHFLFSYLPDIITKQKIWCRDKKKLEVKRFQKNSLFIASICSRSQSKILHI